nr:leucine-rich repeat protein [Lachnospiraceae bacterium]
DDAFCFSICSNMILNDGIKYIGSFAFQDSKLDNVSFPDSVEFIDFGALSGAEQLTDVNLPQNIKVLRPFLFSNTELKNCDIPETVVSIEDGVFRKTGLEKIVIPRNVENLGSSHDRRKYDGYEGDESEDQGILYGCSQLKVLSIMTRKLKNVYSCAMSGINPNATIEVPIGYKDKYTEMFKQGGLPDGVKIVEIEVNDSDLDSVRLNKTKLKLKAKCNRKLELMYTDEPDKVVWKSSNSKVVKIDSSGNARSVAPGKAKITAIYKNHKYVCKVTVTKADANNDEAELKKLIKKQRRWGNLRVSTNIHSKQYKWKKGRLVAIKWSDTEAIGKINLNPFTYLETFDISEAWDDGDCSRFGQYICEIYADDLKHLKKIDLSETFHKRDLPDEFIHTENSPNVKVIREAED